MTSRVILTEITL